MPKKFANENSKAVAARERKKTAKDTEDAKKQKDKDEAYWRDDDKQVVKKQQKKEEQERKRQQQLERKAENKALLEQEQQHVKAVRPAPAPKVTRAQIDAVKVRPAAVPEKKVDTHLDAPLEENINRLQIDGEEARDVDTAISILSSKAGDVDKHPEKRMKAAYTAFEAKRLPELKIENASLKLSQLKQMIFKEWQKSPENPLNQ